jgi:DNA-binding beta-propeller fold protein YncE
MARRCTPRHDLACGSDGVVRPSAGVATVISLLTAATLPAQAPTPPPPDKSYLFFVASEATDQVALVRFGPKGMLIEHRTSVNLNPAEPTRPRGLSVAPDGRFHYVTIRHGFPSGELLKVKIAADSNHRESQPPDTLRGREPLSAFPDAVQVTPDGAYAWIANGNAAGDAKPSPVSVAYLEPMVEVARIQTCAAPRGSRLPADGSKIDVACNGSNDVVKIDGSAWS